MTFCASLTPVCLVFEKKKKKKKKKSASRGERRGTKLFEKMDKNHTRREKTKHEIFLLP